MHCLPCKVLDQGRGSGVEGESGGWTEDGGVLVPKRTMLWVDPFRMGYHPLQNQGGGGTVVRDPGR